MADLTRTTPTPEAIPTLHADHRRALVEGRHPRPHDALGQHPLDDGWVVRVLRPLAASVTVVGRR